MYVISGKPEAKIPLRRPRHRWVDNIEIDHGEIAWVGMDWAGPAQDRDQWRALGNIVMNLGVPENAGKFFGSLSSSA
jgi:hypothetical protein